MSRLEWCLWGLDFAIGGIAFLVGGSYAGWLCLLTAAMLLLIGLTKKEESETKGPPGSVLVDYANRPYTTTPGRKKWHKWGLAAPIVVLIILIVYGVIKYQSRGESGKNNSAPSPPPPQPQPVSLYLGCDWDHIPIHIPAASTVHVMRIHPAILYGNPQIPGIGVFENVSSSSDKGLDWPSKSEGRWMTKPEAQKEMNDARTIPTPYAFKCTLTNYSAVALEDITAELIVDTTDKKRREYPVSFDPLMPGHSFPFYIVNVCSYGVTALMVQWADVATVHLPGEDAKRVPLKFEKRNWPSQLVPPFGASSFLWNGMQTCQWDR